MNDDPKSQGYLKNRIQELENESQDTPIGETPLSLPMLFVLFALIVSLGGVLILLLPH